MQSRLQDLEMEANLRAAEEIGVPKEHIREFGKKRPSEDGGFHKRIWKTGCRDR